MILAKQYNTLKTNGQVKSSRRNDYDGYSEDTSVEVFQVALSLRDQCNFNDVRPFFRAVLDFICERASLFAPAF